MKTNIKGLTGKLFLWLSVGNAAAYLIFHISYLLSSEGNPEHELISLAIEGVRAYISEAWEILFLALISVAGVLAFALCGTRQAITVPAILSLSRVFYCIPYYYMYFVSLGYESLEALPLGALTTLLMALAAFALSLLLMGAGLATVMLVKKARFFELRAALSDRIDERSFWRLPPIALTTLTASLLLALYSLIDTVIEISAFLGEVGLSFTAPELLSMLLELLLVPVYFILTYLICTLIRISEVARARCTTSSDERM